MERALETRHKKDRITYASSEIAERKDEVKPQSVIYNNSQDIVVGGKAAQQDGPTRQRLH